MSRKNKIQDIKHAQDIYDLEPRGIIGIAYKLNCHPRTVERWAKFGIPESYWAKLHQLYSITPYELFRFNEKIMQRYKS